MVLQIGFRIQIQIRNKFSYFKALPTQHTAYLMFSHIIKIKKDGTTKNDERVQQNVSQLINSNEKSVSVSNSGIKAPSHIQRKAEIKQAPRRLKLKDYMRLNQISREKRSRSAQYMKIESNQILNKTYDLNVRTTFGKNEVTASAKKATKNYIEQTSLQRFQLMKTIQKLKDKFNRLMVLIEQTTEKFSNYNDLVFMFRIEEILNDYVKKGIHKITDSYKEYMMTNPIEGIDREMIDVRLDKMISVRNTESPQKGLSKNDIVKMQSLKALDDEKVQDLSILPVSVSMQCSQSSAQKQRSSVYLLKKTT